MSARPKEHWTCQSMTRNLRLKIEEWKKDNLQSSFFFRPFRSTSQTEQTADIKTCSEQTVEETLSYIQQEDWQKELLTCYGNTVTLMYATYKTTKYSIPLLFVYTKTNVSYSVVTEFIYTTDYSDVEIAAVNKLFSKTQVYLCDFHREQAWERWVKEKKHGLSDHQAAAVLDLL